VVWKNWQFFSQKKAKLVEFKLDKHNFPKMYQLFVGKKKKKIYQKKTIVSVGAM
jgi:hypothetical protein